MKQKGILLELFLIKVLIIVMASCSSIPTQSERTIEEVMDKTITHIYNSMSEDEINTLDYNRAMNLFDDDDLKVLSKRHWVFDVNVPAKVFLMRSKKQERIPFWIKSAGFLKTGL